MRLLAAADNVAGEVTFTGVELLNFRPYLAVATARRRRLPREAGRPEVPRRRGRHRARLRPDRVPRRRERQRHERRRPPPGRPVASSSTSSPSRTPRDRSAPSPPPPCRCAWSCRASRPPPPRCTAAPSPNRPTMADGRGRPDRPPRSRWPRATTRIVAQGILGPARPGPPGDRLQPAGRRLEPHGLAGHARRDGARPEPGRRRVSRGSAACAGRPWRPARRVQVDLPALTIAIADAGPTRQTRPRRAPPPAPASRPPIPAATAGSGPSAVVVSAWACSAFGIWQRAAAASRPDNILLSS